MAEIAAAEPTFALEERPREPERVWVSPDAPGVEGRIFEGGVVVTYPTGSVVIGQADIRPVIAALTALDAELGTLDAGHEPEGA